MDINKQQSENALASYSLQTDNKDAKSTFIISTDNVAIR